MPDIKFNKKYWTDNAKALAEEQSKDAYYGIHWGDPNDPKSFLHGLSARFIEPYVDADSTVIEIGPGGGRWTQFLLGFKHIYCVDVNDVMFGLLKQQFPDSTKLSFVQTNGTDFPKIEDNSIDYVFSYGVFVHLDPIYIYDYFKNLKPKMKVGATAVIQYSDKNKKLAQDNEGFAQNNPQLMRCMVRDLGYSIEEEELESLPHSAVIRFSS